ncbi:2-methoxy-6-polyprenyl-1,4-benzoquinol methylase, mitochondrial [Smittium culicis]|uniref:2-methoxy-6-polyprenyl-1,4-benzoquinol methylase, mitochondrial n=1 Tax=Smittium culicis TaxID=133412 RepID=A0A1R1YNS6_9FUNG|nr:2-methoxy-6-polyprenyl-1,4-benzoquinol methylase, mitochondrial [Smittium culicis]
MNRFLAVGSSTLRARQKYSKSNSIFFQKKNSSSISDSNNVSTKHPNSDLNPPINPSSIKTNHTSNNTKFTHFGFETVPEQSKEKLVGNVFSNVAKKYDIMNDAMSGGIHRLWKDHFIRKMAPLPGTKLLDVAGGTGDIAERFLNFTSQKYNDTSSSVHLVDINPDMLNEGKSRFSGSSWEKNDQINFSLGNAEDLSFIPDNSYDVYTIAFGIRNCTHIDRVVKEAHRVLKKGGCFMCLEFSKVNNPIISEIYDIFSFKLIPEIGQLLANDRESYKYLVESIRKFPDQESFANIIREAGFFVSNPGYENLSFGVASIHIGYKL